MLGPENILPTDVYFLIWNLPAPLRFLFNFLLFFKNFYDWDVDSKVEF